MCHAYAASHLQISSLIRCCNFNSSRDAAHEHGSAATNHNTRRPVWAVLRDRPSLFVLHVVYGKEGRPRSTAHTGVPSIAIETFVTSYQSLEPSTFINYFC